MSGLTAMDSDERFTSSNATQQQWDAMAMDCFS
jgi:hypothetical protein